VGLAVGYEHDVVRAFEELRDRQRRFWEWMGFVHLEALSDEILDSLENEEPFRP
jgi:hypothetical protein